MTGMGSDGRRLNVKHEPVVTGLILYLFPAPSVPSTLISALHSAPI